MSDTGNGTGSADGAAPENESENWLAKRLRSSVPIANAGSPDAYDWLSNRADSPSSQSDLPDGSRTAAPGEDQPAGEKTTEEKAAASAAAAERAAAERALAEIGTTERLVDRAPDGAGRSDTIIFDLVEPGPTDEPSSAQSPSAPDGLNEADAPRSAGSGDPNSAVSPIDALFADSRFEQYEAATSARSTPDRWPGTDHDDSTGRLPVVGNEAQSRTELLPEQTGASGDASGRRASFDPLGLAPSGQQAYDPPVNTDQPEPASREKISPFWAMAAVMAVLALGALFFLGTKLPILLGTAPVASIAANATPTPTPTPTPESTGQAAPGEQAWDRLNGGECVSPFTSPFAENFTVVDCAGAHAAQMVLRAPFPSAAGNPVAGASTAGAPTAEASPAGASPSSASRTYPGDAALQSQINLLCTAPGVIDLALAGIYDNIEVQAGYSASAKEWNGGQRDYFCFVTRSEGQLLEGSVAGTPAG